MCGFERGTNDHFSLNKRLTELDRQISSNLKHLEIFVINVVILNKCSFYLYKFIILYVTALGGPYNTLHTGWCAIVPLID